MENPVRYFILAQQAPDAGGGGFLQTIILLGFIVVALYLIIHLKQKATAVLAVGFVIYILGYVLGAQGESKIHSWNFQREAEGIEMMQTAGHIRTVGIIVAIAGGLWLIVPFLQARQKDDLKKVDQSISRS